jgi:hypothetical protein
MSPLTIDQTLLLLLFLATVAYTVFTALLWRVTERSLRTMRQATYGTTLQAIAANHRKIAFRALGSEKLHRAFMSDSPVDEPLDPDTRLFASVLINHLEMLYEHCRFNTLPREFQDGVCRDIIRTMSRVPALRKRWPEMKGQLEPEFVRFVEARLKKEEAR